MTPTTRRSVLAAVGACFSTAGCISDSDGTDPEESTTSERPPGTTTATTDGTTTDDSTTDDSTVYASKEPDPDHRITLNNDTQDTQTIRVRVVRTGADETVFEETREMPPDTEVEVYNLKQADPEGIEPFRVCGELVGSDDGTATTASETTADDESGARDCVTLRTNACYGHAHVTAQEDDSLAVIYSIC